MNYLYRIDVILLRRRSISLEVMFVLETEMVMKIYYKLNEKKVSSLDMISSFVTFIKSARNSIPVNVVAKCVCVCVCVCVERGI